MILDDFQDYNIGQTKELDFLHDIPEWAEFSLKNKETMDKYLKEVNEKFEDYSIYTPANK